MAGCDPKPKKQQQKKKTIKSNSLQSAPAVRAGGHVCWRHLTSAWRSIKHDKAKSDSHQGPWPRLRELAGDEHFRLLPEKHNCARSPELSITTYQACTHWGPLPLSLPSPHSRLHNGSLITVLIASNGLPGWLGCPALYSVGQKTTVHPRTQPSHPHNAPMSSRQKHVSQDPSCPQTLHKLWPHDPWPRDCVAVQAKSGGEGVGSSEAGQSSRSARVQDRGGVTQDPHGDSLPGSSPRVT